MMDEAFLPDGQKRDRAHARHPHAACEREVVLSFEGARVNFVGRNGSRYCVDVSTKVQLNLSSGNRREVRRTQQRRTTWEYNASVRQSGSRNPKWVAYQTSVQQTLEEAFIAFGSSSQSQEDSSGLVRAAGTSATNGRPLDSSSIEFYCGGLPLGVDPPPLGSSSNPDLAGAAHMLKTASPGSLSHQTLRGFCDVALTQNADPKEASRTLDLLFTRHCCPCTVDDARRATLLVGSLAILRLMLLSNRDLQLHGVDIFDRRYPGLIQLNSQGRKCCIKAMLARGAKLGPAGLVPTSKLLRKLDADAFPEWAARYLRSMTLAGFVLPDHAQATVEQYLGLAPPIC